MVLWQKLDVRSVNLPQLKKLSDGRRKCCRCRSYFKPKISNFRLSNYQINHLIEYFCLGVPAYRLEQVMPLSRQITGKFFRFLRQLIYDQSAKELEGLRLTGPNEMDETMFGGKKIPGKRGWGAAGKVIVFGIYKRNGKVVTFTIPNRSKQTITGLVIQSEIRPTRSDFGFRIVGFHLYLKEVE